MPQSRARIRRAGEVLAADAGLTVLLASLFVVLFVIYPFVPLAGPGRLLVTVGLTAIMVSGCFSLNDRPRLRALVIALAAIALTLLWLHHLVPRDAVLAGAYASTILFLALAAAGTLARVLRAGRITSPHIQGAIAVYLMTGLIWGFAYSWIELGRPGSFHLPGTTAGTTTGTNTAGAPPSPGVARRELTYFSFVTLTTLGYGDVVPKSASARTLAILEALVGQLYLVVLIARLVSLRAADAPTGGPPS